MSSDYCQIWLACKDAKEASGIAKVLLEKRLVACAKQLPASSSFLWEGNLEYNKEVALVMETRQDLFESIETIVSKMHSYDTFVLFSVPMLKLSAKAKKWLNKELE